MCWGGGREDSVVPKRLVSLSGMRTASQSRTTGEGGREREEGRERVEGQRHDGR